MKENGVSLKDLCSDFHFIRAFVASVCRVCVCT